MELFLTLMKLHCLLIVRRRKRSLNVRGRDKNKNARMFSSLLGEDDYYHCPNHCGRKYKTEGGIGNHLRLECGKEPQFPCQICGRKFKQKVHMRSHNLMMHGIIP